MRQLFCLIIFLIFCILLPFYGQAAQELLTNGVSMATQRQRINNNDTELYNAMSTKVDINGDIGTATGTSLDLTGTLKAESLELASPPSGSTGEMYVPEDPDNGVNIVGFKAPASLASDTFWVLPNSVGNTGDGFRLTGDLLGGYPIFEMFHLPVTTISTEAPSGGEHGDIWYVVQ